MRQKWTKDLHSAARACKIRSAGRIVSKATINPNYYGGTPRKIGEFRGGFTEILFCEMRILIFRIMNVRFCVNIFRYSVK